MERKRKWAEMQSWRGRAWARKMVVKVVKRKYASVSSSFNCPRLFLIMCLWLQKAIRIRILFWTFGTRIFVRCIIHACITNDFIACLVATGACNIWWAFRSISSYNILSERKKSRGPKVEKLKSLCRAQHIEYMCAEFE